MEYIVRHWLPRLCGFIHYENNTPVVRHKRTRKHIGSLDMRVGIISAVQFHPERKDLLLLTISIGHRKMQSITDCPNKVDINDLLTKLVVVVCNLEPYVAYNQISQAHVLKAVSLDDGKQEFLAPHKDSFIGERVFVQLYEMCDPKTISYEYEWFHRVINDMKTNDKCEATYFDQLLETTAGPVTVESLKITYIQ